MLDVFLHRVNVHAALVGEGARADIRLAGHEIHVGGFVDVAAGFGQMLQRAGSQAIQAVLELEIGDQRDEIHVAAAFADAVDRALRVIAPARIAASALATATAGIIVRVDADGRACAFFHLGDGLGDQFRHRCRRWCRTGTSTMRPRPAQRAGFESHNPDSRET